MASATRAHHHLKIKIIHYVKAALVFEISLHACLAHRHNNVELSALPAWFALLLLSFVLPYKYSTSRHRYCIIHLTK